MITEAHATHLPADLLAASVLDADAGWAALMRAVIGMVDGVADAADTEGWAPTHLWALLALAAGNRPVTYRRFGSYIGQGERGGNKIASGLMARGLLMADTTRRVLTHSGKGSRATRLLLGGTLRAAIHRVQRQRRQAADWDRFWTTLSAPQRRAFLAAMRHLETGGE